MSEETFYFVSDAHLGAPFPDAPEWERSFAEFLRSIRESSTSLYILGDLFDFWIEYRHAIRPDYFRTIHELKNLVDRGVGVHYFAGNHDFALGPFLTDTIGIKVYSGHYKTELQSKKVFLYHGDGLIRKDAGYRILKRLLRNPFNQKVYKKSYLDQGSDIVFFAHTHEAELSRWGEKIYCNTGAWMRTFNFATMRNGTVRLWTWRHNQEPAELPARERK